MVIALVKRNLRQNVLRDKFRIIPEKNYEVAHPAPVDIESVISNLDDDELSVMD
jgi:hypothetical protein